MNVLGIRCSNKDYTFVVLVGSRNSPNLLQWETVPFPQGYAKAQSLKWFLQEVGALIDKHTVERIVIRRYEGRSKGNAFEDRVEHEAMVYLAAANSGVKLVLKKMQSTIAKDLGLKGRAHYLSTSLDTSVISGYEDLPAKAQEAILCAWSELP